MTTFDKVKHIIRSCADLNEADVTASAELERDLGIDSLDMLDVVIQVEVEFGIDIPDDDLSTIVTVQDAVDAVARALKAERAA